MPIRKQQKRAKAAITARKPKQKTQQQIGLLGQALRSLGGLGGSALGSLVGSPAIGSSVGSSLGASLSKWLGAGDYTVSNNSLVQRAASGIPMMHNTGQSVIVRHREFIGTIQGSVGYAVQRSYPLNPGMASTFPWLCSIAARFQEYQFKGLVFHYVPTSGTFNGTSAALGSVMMQTTYRSTDTPAVNKVELLNEYNANESVPFEAFCHPIECDPKENPFSVKYVRTGTITTGEPLMYDVGTTTVATQGMATTDIVGDLWVTYEVELKKPLISSPVVSSQAYFGITYATPTSSSFFSGTATAKQGSLDVTATAKTITLPARTGNFFICVEIAAAAGSPLAHATGVAWDGLLSSSNILAWPYDGLNATGDTAVTGTNPTTENLRFVIGVYLVDPSIPGTITLPNAVWTSGTTSYTSLVVFATGS